MEILKIDDYSFAYMNQEKRALRDIGLTVKRGEFLLLCGPSGCGKSTLLRSIKPQLAPFGKKSGKIFFGGRGLEDCDEAQLAARIGFVMQNPEAQIVTDKVWHELAFGLENLGTPTGEIRQRVAEMANYFGIHTWFRKKTAELSGGQKQLLNLAGVMLMDPELLILDEPTGQLDPIAAKEFIETLAKLNRELGTTIILAEHNLEEAYSLADRVALMEDGELAAVLPPREMASELARRDRKGMFLALPAAARMALTAGDEGSPPLTVAEGKRWFERLFEREGCRPAPGCIMPSPAGGETALELREAWFQYEKGADPVLRGLSLKVRRGEIYALLGGNGSGKTTALSLLSGRLTPGAGRVLISGKDIKKYKGGELFEKNLAVLPQNPQALFAFDTLRRDLEEVLLCRGFTKAEAAGPAELMAKRFGVGGLLERHPYDLSGGELQKAALAKLMLLEPKILLLDEPTKGLDALAKCSVGLELRLLARQGAAILLVTHDVEFCACWAESCALFFDGSVAAEAPCREFFTRNRFYTTAAARITREIAEGVITCEEGVELCKQLLRRPA